jgi:nucleotide-binding universal stress UspA family protein
VVALVTAVLIVGGSIVFALAGLWMVHQHTPLEAPGTQARALGCLPHSAPPKAVAFGDPDPRKKQMTETQAVGTLASSRQPRTGRSVSGSPVGLYRWCMAPEHVLLCYRGSRCGDAALLGAVELAKATGAQLTVVLPMAQAARGPRCCGIQDPKWQELVGDALDDELARAADLVNGAAGQAKFALAEGLSVPEAVTAYARSEGCDLIALPAVGLRLGGDFGRRTERALARSAPCPVVRLPSGDLAPASSRLSGPG